MGLDMYLEAERRLDHCGWRDEPESDEHRAIREAAESIGLPPDNAGDGNFGSITVTVHAGYWRKANQIHSWFVDNVQHGVDECQRSWVPREKLQELRRACEIVLGGSELVDGIVRNGYRFEPDEDAPLGVARVDILEQGKIVIDPSLAQEHLPTREGFFFGSTDYNEWYIEDLIHAIKVIDACLACPDDVDFYYQASW